MSSSEKMKPYCKPFKDLSNLILDEDGINASKKALTLLASNGMKEMLKDMTGEHADDEFVPVSICIYTIIIPMQSMLGLLYKRLQDLTIEVAALKGRQAMADNGGEKCQDHEQA